MLYEVITGLEQPDVLGADRVAVTAGRAEGGASAQPVEVDRQAPDEIEHHPLDSLGVLGEHLEDGPGVDRLRAFVHPGVVVGDP